MVTEPALGRQVVRGDFECGDLGLHFGQLANGGANDREVHDPKCQGGPDANKHPTAAVHAPQPKAVFDGIPSGTVGKALQASASPE